MVSRTTPKLRSGLTLVEVLVVLAILGLLMALLLPAVQQVREAARRTTCSNHLRQLSLAALYFESARQHLPSGWEVLDAADPTAGTGRGWALQLLPYLEQHSVLDGLAEDLNHPDPDHKELLKSLIPVFVCPSDPTGQLVDLMSPIPAIPLPLVSGLRLPHDPPTVDPARWVSRNNYSGVFGSSNIGESPLAGNGCFFGNSRLRLRELGDGLSQTLLIGEQHNHRGYLSWPGVFRDPERTIARVVGTAALVPNDSAGQLGNFCSDHPAGANFALADGSVRLFADATDLVSFHAMATRDEGEVVSLNE